jgi:hypothetical protein
MNRYDPDQAPKPEQWLALDEQTRILLIEDYHRTLSVELPSLQAHAILHATIETQIAENITPVVRAMTRLRREELSRHDALHAVATVLVEHMCDLSKAKVDQDNPNAAYYAALDRFTAKKWFDRYG